MPTSSYEQGRRKGLHSTHTMFAELKSYQMAHACKCIPKILQGLSGPYWYLPSALLETHPLREKQIQIIVIVH